MNVEIGRYNIIILPQFHFCEYINWNQTLYWILTSPSFAVYASLPCFSCKEFCHGSSLFSHIVSAVGLIIYCTFSLLYPDFLFCQAVLYLFFHHCSPAHLAHLLHCRFHLSCCLFHPPLYLFICHAVSIICYAVFFIYHTNSHLSFYLFYLSICLFHLLSCSFYLSCCL